MWGSLLKNMSSSPLGARNRELVLPLPKECWALSEMQPTPGSAPSGKVARVSGGSSGGTACFGLPPPLVALDAMADTFGDQPPRMASCKISSTTPAAAAKDSWNVKPRRDRSLSPAGLGVGTVSGEFGGSFADAMRQQQVKREGDCGGSAAVPTQKIGKDAMAMHRKRRLAFSGPENGCRTRLLTRLLAGSGDDSGETLTLKACQHGPQSPLPEGILKRSSTAPGTLLAAAGGGGRGAPPAALPTQGPHGGRRLRPAAAGGKVHGGGGGDVSGRGSSMCDNISTRSATRKGGNKDRVNALCMGPVSAFECDRQFQKELLEEWRKELEAEEVVGSLQTRQQQQFLNFLPNDVDKHGANVASKCVPSDLLGIDRLEEELMRSAPEFDYTQMIELSSQQADLLRSVLRSYAQVSRPTFGGRKYAGEPTSDRIFRPTFCRFLVDSRLVSGVNNAMGGHPSYHLAVRLFDGMTQSRLRSGSCSDTQSASWSTLKCATVDQCTDLVSQLLGRSEESTQAISNFFGHDLLEAQLIAEAKIAESKARADAAKYGVDEFANVQRSECHSLETSPPRAYDGSLTQWTRGLKLWAKTLDEQSDPEAIADRCEQHYALQGYLNDMLVEPGCVWVCAAYDSLFRTLYEAYVDEERTTYDHTGKPSTVPHMSSAAFFRFCVDFHVFPFLGCFEEARVAYRDAECLVELGGCTPVEKMQRAYKMVHMMIHAIRMFGATSSAPDLAAEAVAQAKNDKAEGGTDDEMGVHDTVGDGEQSSEFGNDSRRSSKSELHRPLERNNSRHNSDGHDSASGREGKGLSISGIVAARRLSKTFKERRVPIIQSTTGKGPDVLREDISAQPNKGGGPSYVARQEATATTAQEKIHTRLGKEGEQPRPTVKVAVDLTPWIRKEFSCMTHAQRGAYSILCALGDCVVDRFLCVRGLFVAAGEGGEQGAVDAAAFLRTLRRLHVVHSFSEEELEAIIRAISPASIDGTIATSGVEQAVTQVRKDCVRRFPWLANSPEWAATEDGTMSMNQSLGDEARRFDDEDVWFRQPDTPQPVTAFGHAAFAESLLRIGFNHMHGSGVASQAVAPGGVKCLWLVAFLRCQLHRHKVQAEARSNEPVDLSQVGAASSACDAAKTKQPAKHGSPPSPTDLSEVSMWPATHHKSSAPFDSSCSTSPGIISMLSPGMDLFQTTPPETSILAGARHIPSLQRLLDKNPDPYLEPARGKKTGIAIDGDEGCIVKFGAVCETCGRERDSDGSGSIFCHTCSGVDTALVEDSILCPVFERRRLRLAMQMPSSALVSRKPSRNSAADTEPAEPKQPPSPAASRAKAKARPRRGSNAGTLDDPLPKLKAKSGRRPVSQPAAPPTALSLSTPP